MNKKLLVNFLLFQIGWLVCVLGGDLVAIGYMTMALIVHGRWVSSSKHEWLLILSIVTAGCFWDILMIQIGVLQFIPGQPLGIPIWLICLWIIFATTFMHCLNWLSRSLWLAGIVAALLGPASYWLGASLSDTRFGTPLFLSLAVMGVGWALIFPLGIYCADQVKKNA